MELQAFGPIEQAIEQYVHENQATNPGKSMFWIGVIATVLVAGGVYVIIQQQKRNRERKNKNERIVE